MRSSCVVFNGIGRADVQSQSGKDFPYDWARRQARKPKIAPETRDALGAIQEIAARVLEDAPDTIAGPIDEIRRLAEGATSK